MVRIVTDSVADLPPGVAEELGITVVPLVYELEGTTYRDGVDLGADDFYATIHDIRRLPLTSAPSPAAFAAAYDGLARECDQILAITLSSKLSSGTYHAALQGRETMRTKAAVTVIDSTWAAMAQGFVVMAAARAARDGASLEEAAAAARATIERVDFLAAFDSLEYLRRGGRIGAAAALAGSLLKINPLIKVGEGLVQPAGRTRTRAEAMDRLFAFAARYERIEGVAVENTACPSDAEALTGRLGELFPRERILQSRMTPVIGTHTGPGLLVVVVLGDRPVR